MQNKYLTDDMNALCNAIIADDIEASNVDDSGYGDFKLGDSHLNFSPWTCAKVKAEKALKMKPNLEGYQDTNGFYWIHAKIDGVVSIGCAYSLNGKPWVKSKNFKFPARVALEDLRARLDRGLI